MLVMAVAACSGDVAIRDLDARYTEAVCKARVRCNLALDTTSCTPLVGSHVPAATVQLVLAHAIGYDPHVAGECVSRVEDTPCDEQDPAFRMRLLGQSVLPIPYAATDPCDVMFAGLHLRGAPCMSPIECLFPPRYAFPTDTRCVNGTCAASDVNDPSCALDEDCATGLYCRAQQCTPQQPLGAACDPPNGCLFPSVCSQDNCVATIAFTAPTGAACSPTVGCADVRDFCDPTGTCARLALPGQPCGTCVPWATCGGDGTCAACANGQCVSGGGW